MFRFEQLDIWKLAMAYAKECYRVAAGFPKTETFALADQLRRAGISISSNIAEGSVELSAASFRHYLDLAVGSTLETVNILYFAKSVGYIDERQRLVLYEKADEIIRKIKNFSKTLK